MLRRALANAGYQVTTATDGNEATAILANMAIDAVVTDLIMPKKDGMQLLMELRKTHPKMPVVVMTGGGHIPSEEYLKFARAFGAHAVLPKPFTREDLIAVLAKLLPAKKAE